MRHNCPYSISKITVAIVVSFLICSYSFAQSKITYSEIGTLSLDSGTTWLQGIFNNAISNDVQIVGLGEVSHGGYEPIALKAKMIQYLVQERGYRNILFEFSDMESIRLVRRYLFDNHLKELAIADSLAGKVAGIKNAERVLAQLFRWLKQYNLDHPSDMVKVTGMDFSYDAGYRNFFLYNYIIPFDPINAQRLLYHWGNGEIPDTFRMASINAWFIDNKSKLEKLLNIDELKELQFYLQTQIHSIDYAKMKAEIEDLNVMKYRDSILANNVTKLSDDQKTIIWAHNAHISTTEGLMGSCLKELYKSRYFILLTDFSSEADVFVNENVKPDAKIIQQHFVAGRTTIANNLLKNYGIPGGIFLNQNFPSRMLFDAVNVIDANGKHMLLVEDQLFDALVIFKNINLFPKAANGR
ncbi:hypothetical protein DVR12_00230 [Chitinophaga silvatica]|uniref:Erythromycin esterase n=1 Tax=Chitinophaga silvatica TaxID=2282649 RepID=A0A3E1YFS1_9BACT|nr:erythromycin esterase family protein [Chitinophaga silvatica]RFS26253.1 hypothetical protein DVR12_00230 [Chitinophaga silvatica]